METIRIELVPDPSHCIETVARKEYELLVKKYLTKGEGDNDFEDKVELLRAFLESADFRELRKESEAYLLEGQNIKFIIYSEQGEIRYRLVHD